MVFAGSTRLNHRKYFAKYINRYTPVSSINETVDTFGSIGLVTNSYNSGALAQNGFIYCPPFAGTSILKINVATGTVSTFGSFGGGLKYSAAITAPNGMIYCLPYDAGNVLKINPKNDATSTFGSGVGRVIDAAMATNGKIYGVGNGTSSNAIVVNTNTDATSTIALGAAVVTAGMILAPNGSVYCLPRTATAIYKINPATDTVSSFGSFSTSESYIGACLAPNSSIYCIPANATTVMKVNTNTDTLSTFGSFSGSYKWSNAFLAPNGVIYGGPSTNASFLKIDPATDTTTTLATSFNKAGQFVYSPEGTVIRVPRSVSTISQMNFGTGRIDPLLLSSYYHLPG